MHNHKNGDHNLYEILIKLNIATQYIEHPPAPTTEIAKLYGKEYDSQHCKNLFFRNHKGDKHYLIILNCDSKVNIHEVEKLLKQGKLSFASEKRLLKYLGVKPGSVTPFGLIYDQEQHVHIFIDRTLQNSERLSFHPCINTASLIITQEDFVRFLDYCGNSYEWIDLY